jgi:hypothetical protein
MVPPARTPCPVDTTPRGIRCVFRVCLCMLLCSARGRADTSTPVPPEPVRRQGSGHRLPQRGQASSRGRRTPRVPRGALSRCMKTRKSSNDPKVFRPEGLRGRQTSSEAVRRPRRRSPNLLALAMSAAGLLAHCWRSDGWPTRRAFPPRWSRGDSNPGPPPCKGGALPAKLRPRATPVRSPLGTALPGGRAWTRTRDLGLIRAAL